MGTRTTPPYPAHATRLTRPNSHRRNRPPRTEPLLVAGTSPTLKHPLWCPMAALVLRLREERGAKVKATRPPSLSPVYPTHAPKLAKPQPSSELDGEATEPTTKTAQRSPASCPPEQSPFPSGCWWPGGHTAVSPRLAGECEEGQQAGSGGVSAPSSPPLQEGTWPTGLPLHRTQVRRGRAPSDLTARGRHPGAGGGKLREARVLTQPTKQLPGGPSARDHEAHLCPSAALGLGARLWRPCPPRAVRLGLRACVLAPCRALAKDALRVGRARPLPGSPAVSCSHTLRPLPLNPAGPCTATSHSMTVAQGVGTPGFRWPLSPEERTGPGADRGADSTARAKPEGPRRTRPQRPLLRLAFTGPPQLHPDALRAHDATVLCHRNWPAAPTRRCLCAEQRGA